MKKLELNQMENVEGGISFWCGMSIAGLAAAWGSAIFFTGGVAAAGCTIASMYIGTASLAAC